MTIIVQDGDYLLPAGQVLDLVRQSGVTVDVFMNTQPHSITIAGTLSIHTNASDLPEGPAFPPDRQLNGISTGFSGDFGAARVLIASTGVLRMDTTQSLNPIFGVIDSSGPSFFNEGLIDIRGAAKATGVAVSDVGSRVTALNSGTILVSSSGGPATGMDIETNSAMGVVNTGLIDVSSGQTAVGLYVFVVSQSENAGHILAHDLGASAHSIGVQLALPPVLGTTFTNSGSIQADVALQCTVTAGSTPSNVPAPVMTVLNSGSMVGEVDFDSRIGVLTNSGSITGAINFGAKNDLYDGRQGTETGLVSGGAGNDTELGGTGFDNFQGNQGDDSLTGAGGDDIVVGGKDNDVQFGDAGADVVWGNLGNDTLDGGDGADQVRGGQGDDSVAGGAGNDFVSGDRGNDTISGGAGADLFHDSQDAGVDRVLDFSLAEGDKVMLDPGTTFSVSQMGADTVIDMGGGNQMILVGVQMSTLPPGTIFLG